MSLGRVKVKVRVRVRVSRVRTFQAYRIDISTRFILQTSLNYYINENIQNVLTKFEYRLSI